MYKSGFSFYFFALSCQFIQFSSVYFYCWVHRRLLVVFAYKIHSSIFKIIFCNIYRLFLQYITKNIFCCSRDAKSYFSNIFFNICCNIVSQLSCLTYANWQNPFCLWVKSTCVTSLNFAKGISDYIYYIVRSKTLFLINIYNTWKIIITFHLILS